MRIREMTAEDIPFVSGLDCSVFRTGWTNEQYRGEIEKEFAHYYIAEEEGIPVGFAGVWCIYETAEISRIAVRKDMRKQGIGGALLSMLIEKAKRRGCERIMLEVRDGNDSAQRLYAHSGFKETALRKNYYTDGDAVIMTLELKRLLK